MESIIYNKKIINTSNQGTGDKSFILGPRTAYQVPFNFGSDWNTIRLGVIWSWVSATGEATSDDTLYNTPISDYTLSGTGIIRYDSGGANDFSSSWFGIMRDSGDNRLPMNSECPGFVGWKGNRIDFSNRADDTLATDSYAGSYGRDNANCLQADAGTYYQSPLVWTRSGSLLARDWAERAGAVGWWPGNNGKIQVIAPRTYGLANPSYAASGSGIDPSASGDYASFWGLEYKYERYDQTPGVTTQYSEDRYKVQPYYYNSSDVKTSGTINWQYSPDSRITDPSKENLRDILNGKSLSKFVHYRANYVRIPTFSIPYSGSPDEFKSANLPNSVFFYNGFLDLNVRIHSWAVLKIN
jgi:hypothetical protein